MKNKYLRMKLAAKRNKKTKEINEKENAEKTINRLTQELESVILKSR